MLGEELLEDDDCFFDRLDHTGFFNEIGIVDEVGEQGDHDGADEEPLEPAHGRPGEVVDPVGIGHLEKRMEGAGDHADDEHHHAEVFVGTFMDITPAVLIFTPIFLPICQSFGMSALQFGIMITYNLCIGTITPPVGNILFVGVKVAKVKLEGVIKPLLSYYAVIFAVLMLVTFIPAVSTWLPGLTGY